jgi:hypothetical protein
MESGNDDRSGKIDFEYVVIFKKALSGTSCGDMLLYILN